MRYLYSALLYILFPLVLLRMLWRSRRAPGYRQRLAERFGIASVGLDSDAPVIWVHAVSVGEVWAAAALLEELLQDYPDHQLLLTTTTPTGSQRAKALFGGRVHHVYAPWDLPGSVSRFLRRTRPSLLLLMETELWPNLLHACHARGCPVLLANGRLSARSARGYARFGPITRNMLAQLSRVACQSAVDGERFLSLGLPPQSLTVTGNIKFDLEVDTAMHARAAKLRQELDADNRPVLVAASTHAGEEALVLQAFARLRQSFGNCLLVLVPRHPERFDAVYALCASQGWQVLRRSSGVAPAAGDAILLGDTMGELRLLFAAATVAFIGGSLVEHGGHNALEACAWGVPVVSGPHTFNFEEITDLLTAAGAMLVLQEPGQLGACLQSLLEDPVRCMEMGAAGKRVLAQNGGARKRLLELVGRELGGA
jgi:3-deoxy-D-manno-octulosonic-acid transferase